MTISPKGMIKMSISWFWNMILLIPWMLAQSQNRSAKPTNINSAISTDSPWFKEARNALLSQDPQALSNIRQDCTTILVMILEEAKIQDIFWVELEAPGNKSLYAIWKLAWEQGLHFTRFLPDRMHCLAQTWVLRGYTSQLQWNMGTPRMMESQNHSVPGAWSMLETPPQLSTTCNRTIKSWWSPATSAANISWPGMKTWRATSLHASDSSHEHINALSIHCLEHFTLHI